MDKKIKSKVCVVGSGPAGSFIAVKLAEKGINVLLLDEGSDSESKLHLSFIDRTHVEKETIINFGLSKQVGGTSNLWSGRISPLEKNDFNSQSKYLNGWPINFSDLEEYYKKASIFFNINYDDMWGSKLKFENYIPYKFNKTFKEEFEYKKFIWNEPIFNCKKQLESFLKNNNNLRLIKRAKVINIVKYPTSSKIRNLKVVLNNSYNFIVEADYFVLANGGLEIPRLLLNSISSNQIGIGNENDMVGRCLMTHPKANVGQLILKRNFSINNPLTDNFHKSGQILRFGIGSKTITHLNHYIQLDPYLGINLKQYFNIRNYSAKESRFYEDRLSFKYFLKDIGISLLNYRAKIDSKICKYAYKYKIRGFLDQIPYKENRLFLSDSKDRYGLNKICICWSLTNYDKNSFINFINKFKSIISKEKLGILKTNLNDIERWPICGIHSHFIGTTRMGTNPKDSVVDTNLKVHEISNLYISGPSVFPTGGYANPFLTIAAISLRLADHLYSKISKN